MFCRQLKKVLEGFESVFLCQIDYEQLIWSKGKVRLNLRVVSFVGANFCLMIINLDTSSKDVLVYVIAPALPHIIRLL